MATDKEIVQECMGGEAKLLYKLLEQYEVFFYTKYLGSHDDADDIWVEVCVKIYYAIKNGKYRGGYKLITWIDTVIKNDYIDSVRSTHKKTTEKAFVHIDKSFMEDGNNMPLFDVVSNASDALGVLDSKQEGGRIIYHLNLLGYPCNKIMELRYIDGRSVKEVSELLTLSMASVRSYALRGKRKLKDMYKRKAISTA